MMVWRPVCLALVLTLLAAASAGARSSNPRVLYVGGGSGGADFSLLAPRGWVPTLTSQNTGKQGLAPDWTYPAQGARLQRGALLLQVEGCLTGDLDTLDRGPLESEVADFTGKAFTRRRAAAIQASMKDAGIPVGPPKKLSPATWLIRATSRSSDLVIRAISGGGCVVIGPARGERGRWSKVPTSVLSRLGRDFHGWFGEDTPQALLSPSLLGRKIVAKAREYSDTHPVHIDYSTSAFGSLKGYERDPTNGYRYWEGWRANDKILNPAPALAIAGLPGSYMSKLLPEPGAESAPECWLPFDPSAQEGRILLDIDRWVIPRNNDHWWLKWEAPKNLGSGQQQVYWRGYWSTGSAVVTTSQPIRLISAQVSRRSPWNRKQRVFFKVQFSYPGYIQKISTPTC